MVRRAPRGLAKRGLEHILVLSGGARLGRTLHKTRTVILAYHNVVPAGEPVTGDGSLHLAQGAFAEHLDELQRTHEVIPLADIFDPARGDRPRAVLTFDDAYRGAVTAGVAELAKRGMPGTLFVAPGLLGAASTWWDALADPGSNLLSAAVRRRALEEGRGRDETVRTLASEAGHEAHAVPRHQGIATVDELLEAAALPGITVASHTWSHANLARLTPDEVVTELHESLAWLASRFASWIPWVSYPYGIYTTAIARAAADAGYAGALLVSGGWLPAAAEAAFRHALPRLNVPAGVTREGFALRAAGIVT